MVQRRAIKMTPGGGGVPCVNPAHDYASSSAHRSPPVIKPDTSPTAADPEGVENYKTNSTAFRHRAARLFASPFDFADLTQARKSFSDGQDKEGTFTGVRLVCQHHRGRGASPPKLPSGQVG